MDTRWGCVQTFFSPKENCTNIFVKRINDNARGLTTKTKETISDVYTAVPSVMNESLLIMSHYQLAEKKLRQVMISYLFTYLKKTLWQALLDKFVCAGRQASFSRRSFKWGKLAKQWRFKKLGRRGEPCGEHCCNLGACMRIINV